MLRKVKNTFKEEPSQKKNRSLERITEHIRKIMERSKNSFLANPNACKQEPIVRKKDEGVKND